MLQSEIKIGGIYTNHISTRQVVDIEHHFRLQGNTRVIVTYVIINNEQLHTCTLCTFAHWEGMKILQYSPQERLSILLRGHSGCIMIRRNCVRRCSMRTMWTRIYWN